MSDLQVDHSKTTGALVEERAVQMRRALEKNEAQEAVDSMILAARKDIEDVLVRAQFAERGEEVVSCELTFNGHDEKWGVVNYDGGMAHKITPQSLEQILFGPSLAIEGEHEEQPSSPPKSPLAFSQRRHGFSGRLESTDSIGLGGVSSMRKSYELGTITRELMSKESSLQMLADRNRALRSYIEVLQETIRALGAAVPQPSDPLRPDDDEEPAAGNFQIYDEARLSRELDCHEPSNNLQPEATPSAPAQRPPDISDARTPFNGCSSSVQRDTRASLLDLKFANAHDTSANPELTKVVCVYVCVCMRWHEYIARRWY